MIRLLLSLTLRRIAELLLGCAFISAMLTLLCVMGIFPDGSVNLVLALGVFAAIFLLLNIRMMRACNFAFKDNILYFVANICAHVAFLAANFYAYRLCSDTAYTWLFAITKFAKYSSFSLTSWDSAVIFHIILGILIFLAPIGMGRIYMEEEEFLENDIYILSQEMEAELGMQAAYSNNTEGKVNEGTKDKKENPLS